MKTVSIETYDSATIQEMKVKLLNTAFNRAVTGMRHATIESSGDSFCFTASRSDFKKLVEQKVLPPEIETAFLESDTSLANYDAGRKNLLTQIWDSFIGHAALTGGYPLAKRTTAIENMGKAYVTVKRFGVAE